MSRQGYNHGAAARAGTGFETSYCPERNSPQRLDHVREMHAGFPGRSRAAGFELLQVAADAAGTDAGGAVGRDANGQVAESNSFSAFS